MKKIGFTADDSDNKEEKKDGMLEMIMEMINKRYAPSGDRNKLCYKTSREIAYELREMMPATMGIISKAMRAADYQLKIIGDLPHWEMYDSTQ